MWGVPGGPPQVQARCNGPESTILYAHAVYTTTRKQHVHDQWCRIMQQTHQCSGIAWLSCLQAECTHKVTCLYRLCCCKLVTTDPPHCCNLILICAAQTNNPRATREPVSVNISLLQISQQQHDVVSAMNN